MDRETRAAIRSVRTEVTSVRAEVGSLRVEVGSIRNEVTSLRTEVTSLGKAVTSGDLQVRRHMDVLFESLRDDIRLLADGLVSLDAKVESMRR